MREEEVGVGGARELLQSLPLHTLITLAQTVTRALVDTPTEHDAIKAIILHSSDLESILRRKVITREILFQYLHQKGVSVTPSTIKPDLIAKILCMWFEENIYTIVPTQPEVCTDVQNVCPENVAQIIPTSDAQLQVMAQKFVQWFYPLLNDGGLHPDNFWENAELLLKLRRYGGEIQTVALGGVARVVDGLAQMVRECGMALQPSAAGGLSAEMDPHGLVLIESRGAVYSRTSCSGVYEQSFLLTADPHSQGDWRIKRSELDVRLGSGVPAVPPAPSETAIEGGSVCWDMSEFV